MAGRANRPPHHPRANRPPPSPFINTAARAIKCMPISQSWPQAHERLTASGLLRAGWLRMVAPDGWLSVLLPPMLAAWSMTGRRLRLRSGCLWLGGP
eukprot:6204455-Pyramimonas_sp.AAC.1